MTYGYARVSTKEQNTARQIDAFRAEGVDVIVEEHESGKDFSCRREYNKLRRKLKEGDTLVVMSLDRFGRNYDEILEEWRYLTNKRCVKIRVMDMPILSGDTVQGLIGKFISDLVLQLLAFVAQNERERIRERQKQGIASAHVRGVKFGRPRIKMPDNLEEIAQEEATGKISIREAARRSGINKTSYQKYTRNMFPQLFAKEKEPKE